MSKQWCLNVLEDAIARHGKPEEFKLFVRLALPKNRYGQPERFACYGTLE
jgi:hypothetical protein